MKQYYLFVLGVVITTTVFAQGNTKTQTRCTVVDAATEKPIKGAEAFISRDSLTLVTNKKGVFTVASNEGCMIEVKAKGHVRANIFLDPGKKCYVKLRTEAAKPAGRVDGQVR